MKNKIQMISDLINIDGIEKKEIIDSITVPAEIRMGDYSLPCFKFAKVMRKSPVVIANELAAAIKNLPEEIEKIEAVNGYLNFYLNKYITAKNVLNEILEKGEHYGDSDMGKGRNICIDYSSINIAKPFHIGHLSTTVIGGSLYKLYNKLGYHSIGINHLGDWGTQFGKLIVAYKLWCDESTLSERGMDVLTEIYVKFHTEAEKNPELNDMAREWFCKIEQGDEEAMRLFSLFKDITLREVRKTYKRLNITFDSYKGEAFYNDKMQPVLDELEKKGLLTVSDGAKVVDLSRYGMPPCLLVKADGATLYATRDLAAAYYRKATYDFEKCLYVVAYQQNLHFKQWFKVIELLGNDWYDRLYHIAFGMVSLESGAMSTRKGKVVLLEDVLNKAVEKSLETINEKNPDLEDKEEIAEQVGVGAVIFSALYNSRIKDIVFKYDKVLNFDGETAPYIQYTNARANSVLEKLEDVDYEKSDYNGVLNEEGYALIAQLSKFPETIIAAVDKNEPCFISRYLIELCKGYNRFYFAHRIIDQPLGIKAARGLLTYTTHIVLEEGLRLLGIKAPKKM